MPGRLLIALVLLAVSVVAFWTVGYAIGGSGVTRVVGG